MRLFSSLVILALCVISVTGCGSGSNPPQDAISPGSITFEKTLLGTQSAQQTIKITSAGLKPLTVTSVSVTGSRAGDFKASNHCTAILQPGNSCEVQVLFAPTSTVPAQAVLAIRDDAHSVEQQIQLQGTGTVDVVANPATVDFGKRLIGTQTFAQVVTVTNPGQTPMTISGISVTGLAAATYGLSNSCGSSLDAGASCPVRVMFSPKDETLANASIQIVSSAANSPFQVPVTGKGLIPPSDTISPGSIVFENTLLGSKSTPRTITITSTSTGSTAVAIQSISLTGAQAGDFQILNNCAASLQPGTSCQVRVSFAPTSTEPAQALLAILDNAHDSAQFIQLAGTGTVNAVATPASVDFGKTLVGTQTFAKAVTMTNPGQTPMAIGGTTVTGADAAPYRLTSNCGSTLDAGASCTVQVSFAPKDETLANASIQIVSSAANSPLLVPLTGKGDQDAPVDIVVYGASPAGIFAAVEAARHGKQVVLLEPIGHVGGMMSNGLGATDIYPNVVFSGLQKDFFDAMRIYYAGDTLSNGGVFFEPHVAEQMFASMLGQYTNLAVFLGRNVTAVQKDGTRITGATMEDGQTFHAAEFIDASYTGDLMALAGVSYTVGRESKGQYGEVSAGIGALTQYVNRPISAYVVKGDPGSGLLPHVSASVSGPEGGADETLMAYNYRLCLSSDPTNQIPFAKPDHYDPAEFELVGRAVEVSNPKYGFIQVINAHSLGNHKFDLNSSAIPSTDEIGANYGYPDGTKSDRAAIEKEVKRYMQGFLYFVATDPRMPPDVQSGLLSLGLCKDEFTDNGGWPNQIYVREARRMLGAYILTENDVKVQTAITDSIGTGGYSSDDHLHQVVASKGYVLREGSKGYQPPPYAIPYRILTPKAEEITNLLVPVSVSASHWAYDSLRVEITYMTMGQGAGAAAALAIDENVPVQNVSVGALQNLLTSEGVNLVPIAVP